MTLLKGKLPFAFPKHYGQDPQLVQIGITLLKIMELPQFTLSKELE